MCTILLCWSEEDYFSSEMEPMNSQEKLTNSEDTDEICIDNQQIESISSSSNSDLSSDPYFSNFHFIKNLTRMEIL